MAEQAESGAPMEKVEVGRGAASRVANTSSAQPGPTIPQQLWLLCKYSRGQSLREVFIID